MARPRSSLFSDYLHLKKDLQGLQHSLQEHRQRQQRFQQWRNAAEE